MHDDDFLSFFLPKPSHSQCTVNMEGGKMVCNTGKFCHVQELKGGEMIEVGKGLSTLYKSERQMTNKLN